VFIDKVLRQQAGRIFEEGLEQILQRLFACFAAMVDQALLVQHREHGQHDRIGDRLLLGTLVSDPAHGRLLFFQGTSRMRRSASASAGDTGLAMATYWFVS
jgi:hypothetical protein